MSTPPSTQVKRKGLVLGFLLNEDYLLQNALKHHLGTEESQWQRDCARSRAAESILNLHGVYPYLIAGVEIKGKLKMCAAIAAEDREEHLPMPPRETIERLKKMIATDKEPRWYIQAV